jgi:membrane fusion protein, multidrug efflux system
MNSQTTAVLLCLSVVCCGGPIGCRPVSEAKSDNKPECSFLYPQSKDTVQDFVEYTGRTAAVAVVDVKARVTGFLKEVRFKEGTRVKKGQELFLIDPEPYIAQYDQAKAQVDLYKAQVELTTRTYEQAQMTKKKNPETFSDLQLRTYAAQMDEAVAGMKAAEATLKIYRINKNYTSVTSPIDGLVGRKNQTPGNVILQDQTLLTTVVSLDQLYVYFDMDAPTYTKFDESTPGKKAQAHGVLGSLFLELPGNPSSPSGDLTSQIEGSIDFFNNQFNPATDTLLVRGVFTNPKKPDGIPRLRPGMFVRVKLPIGQPYKALLVPDRAILSKMGKKYVYVADADNRVKEIPVVIGQPQENGLRVIKGGELTGKDRVIVTRLLDIQPKQEIRPVALSPSVPDAAAPGVHPGPTAPVDKSGTGNKGQ